MPEATTQTVPTSSTERVWAVFTKPWRSLSIPALGKLVARMGFNAVEFPLRPGYQVDLDHLESSLTDLVRILADQGIGVASVATDPEERRLAACAEQGIDLIRIMAPIDNAGFVASKDAIRSQLDTLVPLALKHGTRIGVQPHHDFYIADSSELAVLLDDYDPAGVVAIWDAAHDGLACKRPANALALLWDRLAMANFKNAYQQRSDRRFNGAVEWDITFVEGAEGLCSWPEAAHYLRDHAYTGPICLPAEYTDETDLENKTASDLAYLKAMLDIAPTDGD